MHRSLVRSSVAVVALIALAACGEMTRKRTPPDLFGSDLIARTARDVEAKVGAPLRLLVLSAERGNGLLSLQVQDPKKPENVDEYQLRQGRLEGPHPVQLMGDGTLEENLWPLSAVDLARIPEFAKAAAAKLGIEDGAPSSITLRMGEPADAFEKRMRGEGYAPELAVKMYVDGPRRKGMVQANASFEITKETVF